MGQLREHLSEILSSLAILATVSFFFLSWRKEYDKATKTLIAENDKALRAIVAEMRTEFREELRQDRAVRERSETAHNVTDQELIKTLGQLQGTLEGLKLLVNSHNERIINLERR